MTERFFRVATARTDPKGRYLSTTPSFPIFSDREPVVEEFGGKRTLGDRDRSPNSTERIPVDGSDCFSTPLVFLGHKGFVIGVTDNVVDVSSNVGSECMTLAGNRCLGGRKSGWVLGGATVVPVWRMLFVEAVNESITDNIDQRTLAKGIDIRFLGVVFMAFDVVEVQEWKKLTVIGDDRDDIFVVRKVRM